MVNVKYNVYDVVYIVDVYKVIKCTINQIIITKIDIKYKLINENFNEYVRLEDEIFDNIQDANKYLNNLNTIEIINKIKYKIGDYQNWVSELEYAIQNYSNCETDIEINLISNETNGKNKEIFGVTSTGSKQLLEYIKKYFQEELDKREKELKKLQEQLNEKK